MGTFFVVRKYSKKIQNGWAFYDWANSVYPLVITSAVFPIFYSNAVADRVTFWGIELANTVLISYVTAASFLVVVAIMPLLSGVADFLQNKKRFLQFFCYLGGTSSITLAFFNPEHLELSMLAFFVALLGFWSSLVFYNAYLPEIAPPEEHDKLSAKGFSLGYIGSSTLLIICLAMITLTAEENKGLMTRISFALTGVWWMGFSQITYARLPKVKARKKAKNVIWKGYQELRTVYKDLSHNIQLKRYLTAFFIYSMAVQTVMMMAAYFGAQEVEWGSKGEQQTGLIVSILLIQFLGVIGAMLLAKISSKIGNIKSLMLVVLLWAIICVAAFFIYKPVEFYITAACVGLVMGGIQALSRSTYSKFLPETSDTTSYFAFYDISEKVGIIIGTLSFGFIQQYTGSMRYSILALIIFFMVGFILLFRVPKWKEKNN